MSGRRKAIAYVDGFNFYNGCVRTEPQLKWLDLRKLSELLLRGSHCDVTSVRYYTSKVFDMPDRGGGGQRRRQEVYLRALGALPGVEVVFGQFKRRDKVVRLCKPLVDGTRYVRARTIEEKGSDVNLATDLLWDALHIGGVDTALVVSNDFDLQRPIERLMAVGVEVVTVNPHRHHRQRPSLTSTRRLNLRRWHLERCQLPDRMTDARGRKLTRPEDWT